MLSMHDNGHIHLYSDVKSTTRMATMAKKADDDGDNCYIDDEDDDDEGQR